MGLSKHVANHHVKEPGEVQGEYEGIEKTGNPLEEKKKNLILSSLSPCRMSSSPREENREGQKGK